MYIYENHLGGLYSSEWQLDWDDLYCEQCGDSDWEIGNFETAEELWDFIKPYDLECIGCKNDSLFCEQDCSLIDEYSNYNSYGLPYCMNFIVSTFDFDKYRYIYLICQDKRSKRIFVKYKPQGHKFGEYNQLPNCFSFESKLDDKVALSLVPNTCDLIEEPKKIKTIKKDNVEYIIYKCIVNKSSDDRLDSAYYYDDNWYGWCKIKDYKCLPGEEFLGDIL